MFLFQKNRREFFIYPPVCIDRGDTLTQAQDLGLSLVELYEVCTGPQADHLVSYANLLRVPSISLSMWLMKLLNSTSPHIDPWGRLLITFPLWHWDIDYNSMDTAIQPTAYPCKSPSIKPMSLLARGKNVGGNISKTLQNGMASTEIITFKLRNHKMIANTDERVNTLSVMV